MKITHKKLALPESITTIRSEFKMVFSLWLKRPTSEVTGQNNTYRETYAMVITVTSENSEPLMIS